MPLYFAYGSNMDAAAMRKRCPRSSWLGAARLMHRRFVIMRNGYASVEPDPTGTVHGVLFDLAAEDFPALDRYEGLSDGLYTRLIESVFRDNGAAGPAFVYLGREAAGGTALPGYMEGVLACARAAGLPREYLMELERHVPANAVAAAQEPASPGANL